MKLPEKAVTDYVQIIAGEDAVQLVLLLKDKKDVNEFKIAEKLEISVNQVRNIIYRLSESNLVSFIRKKDKQKGWYIYYWTFDNVKAKRNIIAMKQKRISDLNKQIHHEQRDIFYICPNNCTNLNSEEALEINFTCQECGSIFVQDNVKEHHQRIRKEITQLKEDIKELEAIKEKKKELVEKPKKKAVKKKTTKKKVAKKKKTVKKKAKKTIKKKTLKKKTKVKKPKKKAKPKKTIKKKSGILRKIKKKLKRRR